MDSNITLQTKQMIDSLKAVCTNFGLGNASSEYKIITEVFLYKFLNDKFLFEAKRVEPALAKLSPADAEKQLAQMTDDDYELFLLGFGPDTAKLKQTHFISYLFNRKNEENFHMLFDDTLLDLRKCRGIEISREEFCCAVSIHHRLAKKEYLEIQDLYGENLKLIHRGWSEYIDILRDDLWEHHPEIQIVDFDFYNMETFNRCENSNDVLLAVKSWESIHPLMKIIPVNWNYGIPFGLLYSKEPSRKVKKVLDAIERTRDL